MPQVRTGVGRLQLPLMRKVFLLVAALPLAAFAQTPCASPIVAKITPCAANAPADVIATLDEKPIRVSDLDEETRKSIEGLDAAIATARARAMREELDDALLAREAA